MDAGSDLYDERPKRSSRRVPIVYDEEADEFLEHDRKRRAKPKRTTRGDDRTKRAVPKRTAQRDVSTFGRTNGSDDPNSLSKAAESQAWTDKYRPSKSRPFVGNNAAISELRTWLSAWKERHAEWTLSMKPGHSQSDSEDSVEALSNCVLLTGPPGVGKTSATYFLAEELGYRVLEVHASSERTGRKILSQLHEATQSHHVEGTKLPPGGVQACLATGPPTRSQPETPARKRGRPPKHQIAECEPETPIRKRGRPPKHPKAECEPETPIRKRGRPPKLLKAGPLQKLFQQTPLKGIPQKIPSKPTNPQGCPKECLKTTITGYFAVKTEEKSVPKGTVVPGETVVPRQNLKGTLLDYFGGSATKRESVQVVSTTKLMQNQRSVSSGDTEEDVVLVGISTQACKSLLGDKQMPKSVKRLSTELRDGEEYNSVHLVSAARQATSEKSKNIHENHVSCAGKKQTTKPPLPTNEPKGALQEAAKSNLSYSSLSIILFDDVDTIFTQDDGFWSAVESVLASSKKPVIFTATRDLWEVRSKLPSYCPIIKFASPMCEQVVELLKEICSLEGVSQPSNVEMEFLVQYHHCDIRRCLSELQMRTVLHPQMPGVPAGAVLALGDLPLGDKLRNVLRLDSCAEIVEAQLMFEELGLDLAYLSLPDMLPFPVIKAQQEQPVTESSAEKEQRVSALDISWLSDRESSEETDAIQVCKDDTEIKPTIENVGLQARLSKPCLGQLADMFDSFSLADSFSGCLGFGPTNVQPSERIYAWQDGAAIMVGERRCSLAASEALAYFEACSAKLKAHALHRLVREAEAGSLELSFVSTHLTPSLSNLYGAAESRRVLVSNRRQIMECAVPASAAINSSAVLDFLSALRLICMLERQRMGSNSKRSRRFLHYLESCSLFLSDSTIGFLCAGLN